MTPAVPASGGAAAVPAKPKNELKDISVTAKFDKCSQSTFTIASATPANTLTLVADDLADPLLSAVADWYT